MTKQIKHKRTSKLGRNFPAGSRIEVTPQRVPLSIKQGKYGEFKTKEEFDDFKTYMEESIRDNAYEDAKEQVRQNPEDYVNDNALDRLEMDYGADAIQGMESMERLKRNYKTYEEGSGLGVKDFISMYKDKKRRESKIEKVKQEVRKQTKTPFGTFKTEKKKTKTPFGEIESI